MIIIFLKIGTTCIEVIDDNDQLSWTMNFISTLFYFHIIINQTVQTYFIIVFSILIHQTRLHRYYHLLNLIYYNSK